jgi:hypothetical protein
MGQGILEAGARIGQTLQGGYESMGKGLAGGISAVAGAYGDYKKMESGIKASEKAFDTFRSFLSPEVQKSIDDRITEMNKDTSLSLQDKAAFWDQAKAVMGGAINQKFAIDKQQQELDARRALNEAELQNRLDLEQQRARHKALEGGGGMVDFGLKPGQEGTGAKSSLFNKRFGF